MCRAAIGRSFRVRALLLTLGWTLLASLLQCGGTQSVALRYELHWLGPEPERLVNDRGLSLHIDQMYLSHASLELLACGEDEASASRAASARPFRTWMAVAAAGHGDVRGPTALRQALPEWLGPRVTLSETVSAPPGAYCGVHVLIARSATPDGLTGADVPPQTSLFLRGRAQGADGTTVDFVVHSKLAHGAVFDLEVPLEALQSPRDGTTHRVLLERNLGALFDGVELRDLRNDRVDRTILRNLMRATRAQVASRPEARDA